jgi:hypothetical protein
MLRVFTVVIKCLFIAGVSVLVTSSAFAQREIFEDVTLTGGADLDADVTFRPNNNGAFDYRLFAPDGGASLDIDTPLHDGAVRILKATKSNTLVTNLSGVGIGTHNPVEPLHIFSGAGSALPRARLLIEDRNPAVAIRNLLALTNNGGGRITLTNSNTGDRWLITTDNADTFYLRMLGTGKPSFQIRESGQLSVNVNSTNTLVLQNNGNMIIAGNLFEGSDRNRKHNFQSIDSRQVLEKVVQLPISSWSFKHDESGTRHIGPMAQDFRAAFGLGQDEKTIATIDSAGVSLAAIQGLHELVKEKDAEIDRLEREFKSNAAEFNQRLEELEALADSLKPRS